MWLYKFIHFNKFYKNDKNGFDIWPVRFEINNTMLNNGKKILQNKKKHYKVVI